MKKSRNNDLQNTTQKTNDRTKNKWLARVLRECKQFLLYMYNPLCYSSNKPVDKALPIDSQNIY